MDWDRYDQQEDKEPFDAVLEAEGSVGPADRDRYEREKKVQEYLRMAKMHAISARSRGRLSNFVGREPAPDADHCRARLGGKISPLLTWHYYLALYFTERGDWLTRAIPLILDSAERAGGDGDGSRRSSSYLLLAHNLNRWHNCGKDGTVLEMALRLARERRGDRQAHWFVAVVADLERRPDVMDEMRDLMLEAAGGANPNMADLYLEAAVSVADDKAPAKAARADFHERQGDGLNDPMLKIIRYNDAKQDASGREEQRRINEKIRDAQKSVTLSKVKHHFKVPREDIPGENGFDRVRYLCKKLRVSIPSVEAARMKEEKLREDFPLQDLFASVKLTDAGIPGPSPHAKAAGGANHVDQFASAIRFFRMYFSANVREYERDGRITEDSYAGCLESSGLLPQAAMRLARAGIGAHCSGNYIESIHVLLPQLEQTLRLLLEQRGAKMLAGRDRVATALLKPMLKEGRDVIGEDIAELLRVWLIDEAGINLRNRVCHALYADYQNMDGYDPLHDLDHGTSLLLILFMCLLAEMSVDGS